jgi:hypothetical protein
MPPKGKQPPVKKAAPAAKPAAKGPAAEKPPSPPPEVRRDTPPASEAQSTEKPPTPPAQESAEGPIDTAASTAPPSNVDSSGSVKPSTPIDQPESSSPAPGTPGQLKTLDGEIARTKERTAPEPKALSAAEVPPPAAEPAAAAPPTAEVPPAQSVEATAPQQHEAAPAAEAPAATETVVTPSTEPAQTEIAKAGNSEPEPQPEPAKTVTSKPETAKAAAAKADTPKAGKAGTTKADMTKEEPASQQVAADTAPAPKKKTKTAKTVPPPPLEMSGERITEAQPPTPKAEVAAEDNPPAESATAAAVSEPTDAAKATIVPKPAPLSPTLGAESSPNLLAELGAITSTTTSPLTHLMVHGPRREERSSRKTAADVPELQPPMKHGLPVDTREPSPVRARQLQIVVDKAVMEKTLEEKRQAREMRKERKRRERERLQEELAEAERQAMEAAKHRDMERGKREEQLRDRLDLLRQRRSERELEFLVSEKRAQQVRASKSLADVIQEQYEAKERAAEEERQRLLHERRERLHAPVLTGVEAVQRHFSMVEDRKARKAEELKERQSTIEQRNSAMQEPYHGSSYEMAVESHIRFRNGDADTKHQRLYKHAKMQEYGNLVKRLYGPVSRTPQPSDFVPPPPPFVTAPHQQQPHGICSPVVVKESQAPAERNKAGNQYLRQALATKPAPPPGLKLEPIKDARNEEFDRFKERKKKGDKYLREVRELPLRRSHSSLHASRDDEEMLQEIRRLKAKTASLENRLHGGAVDLSDPEACLQTNEQYLEVVRLKLEMLRRADQGRK